MHPLASERLPPAFCWTRFGPEAGESLDQILTRKNAEREACAGTFYWGIGSAVGPALAALVAQTEQPEVLFSPIKSPPRPTDVSPPHIVRWSAGKGLFGGTVELPTVACVTSRWDPTRPSTPRYALVCSSDQPLCPRNQGELRFETLSNLRSGSPLGASQVTAVVRRRAVSHVANGRTYPVALRALLVWPYLVRLHAPRPIGQLGENDFARSESLRLAV